MEGENGQQFIPVNQQIITQDPIVKTLNDLLQGEFDIVVSNVEYSTTQRQAQMWSLVDAASKLSIPHEAIFETLIDLSDLPKKKDIKIRWQQQQEQQFQLELERMKKADFRMQIAFKDAPLPIQIAMAAQAGIIPQEIADHFLQIMAPQLAQLAEYQRQAQQSQPQAQTQQQQFQPPQFQITPEISAKISAVIKAEVMVLTSLSNDDVASLEYADADDPRIVQWNQAQSIAQNRVYNAIQQAQIAQQQQAQQFYNNHIAATQTYNEFAQKEFAEPDFKEIQQFATNEFFEQLAPNEKQIIANSYLRVERQIASPAEMLVVKNYYERAKAAYRTRDAKKSALRQQPAAQLPRADQLKGASGAIDGQLSARDFEKLLEGNFTKLDEKT